MQKPGSTTIKFQNTFKFPGTSLLTNQSNTKLYPIPDVNADDEDMAPLKGEQEPHNRTPIAIPSLSIMSLPVPESPTPQIR